MNRNIAVEILEENRDFENSKHLVDIEGMSSPRVCNFLNQLVSRMDPEESYLEIGTWKGLTLISAAYRNFGRTCIGCDKFRFFGRYTGLGIKAKWALRENIDRFRGKTAEIIFHQTSSRSLLAGKQLSSPVGVYFYDGDHSYSGTRHGVRAAVPFLSERSILLVDDWNDPAIQKATHDGIEDAHFHVHWSRELEGDHSVQGWWNGLAAFYLEKD